jgi:hypothetical protein
MYKALVTSGCSFSLYDISDKGENGWPHFLQEKLLSDGILSKDFDSFHRGVGGNGNMLIARNTMEAISRLLDKGMKGEEILCVVEWSGITRHQLFLENTNQPIIHHDVGIRFEGGEYKDLSESKRNGYYLVNSGTEGWHAEHSLDLDKIYFKHFQNVTNDVINSLWNWLALQQYCELNNVNPFYTFMFEHDRELMLEDSIGHKWSYEYLQKQIKKDNVLTSITKYLEEHSFKNLFMSDGHPSKRGHKVFSDYLKKGLTST